MYTFLTSQLWGPVPRQRNFIFLGTLARWAEGLPTFHYFTNFFRHSKQVLMAPKEKTKLRIKIKIIKCLQM